MIATKKQASIHRGNRKNVYIWSLSRVEVAILITAPCHYCTRYFHQHMGIDRKNNNLGYISSNVVTCCKYCNAGKSNMTIEEFKIWIKKVIVAIDSPKDFIENRVIDPTRYRDIRKRSKTLNKKLLLTKEECYLLLHSNCYYCNSDQYLGIDRLDSSIFYQMNNCVSCCKFCNQAKSTQTEQEFREMITLLYTNMDNF